MAFNLAVIGYFKYRNFLLENAADLFGYHAEVAAIAIPLGISFHTFQQVAFLVDVGAGHAKVPRLKSYALFVLFFPQLIAGPIVLHHEFEGQAEKVASGCDITLATISRGLALLVLGLFKKVCLADGIAPYADAAFAAGIHLQPVEAWVAALAFTLQVFFDFSGYSDMAVGLGLLFGIRLPLNFDNPLRATSMIAFWSRWHMTMTRFFTSYVYVPLAVPMARWAARREAAPLAASLATVAVPTMATFLLSGLWHGAAWTFVAFGAVNGAGLVVNHLWRRGGAVSLGPLAGWLLTMAVVLVGGAFYRAETLAQGAGIVAAMLSPWAIGLPEFMEPVATRLGWGVAHYEFLIGYGIVARVGFWLALLLGLVFVLPNWTAAMERLQPDWRLAFALSLMLWLTLGVIGEPRTFLYFQF